MRRRRPEWQDTKPVIRTDNGPQFISQLFEETCEHLGLEHERIPILVRTGISFAGE
ncbi:MAG: hypothetical protein ACM3VX_10630 [Bacteroidota bacterium]